MKPAVKAAFPGAPAYFRWALSHIGLPELIDGKLNPQIEAWLVNHTRFPAKLITAKTMWCGAFVSAALERSALMSTHSAAAESYLKFGRPCDLELYAIVVLKHHVGFVAGEADDKVLVLGGNQNNQVCIKHYPKLNVLGYRMPV